MTDTDNTRAREATGRSAAPQPARPRGSGVAGRLPIDPDAPDRAARRSPAEWDVLAAIAAGGALGATARYAMSLWLPTRTGEFPWGTFWTNVSGCFVLALLMMCLLELVRPSRYLRPFAGVGFVGAYTTFSTVMVECDQLLAHGHARVGLAYLGASTGASLGATTFGFMLGRAVVMRSRHPKRPDAAVVGGTLSYETGEGAG